MPQATPNIDEIPIIKPDSKSMRLCEASDTEPETEANIMKKSEIGTTFLKWCKDKSPSYP